MGRRFGSDKDRGTSIVKDRGKTMLSTVVDSATLVTAPFKSEEILGKLFRQTLNMVATPLRR